MSAYEMCLFQARIEELEEELEAERAMRAKVRYIYTTPSLPGICPMCWQPVGYECWCCALGHPKLSAPVIIHWGVGETLCF